jgi:ribonuclease HI
MEVNQTSIIASFSMSLEKSQKLQTEEYHLFSDGACRGNPGPGAYAAIGEIFKEGNVEGQVQSLFTKVGFDQNTTNNRMELLGAIWALKEMLDFIEKNKINHDKIVIKLFSDSKYVVDGITKWIVNWVKRGWKKADGGKPENIDLWKELFELKLKFKDFSELEFIWVKGHSGHQQNEICDQLCNELLDEKGH